MNDVMIDIETMSTKTNATILTIGAIKFRQSELLAVKQLDMEEMETFYIRVDINSCAENEMDISEETREWWGKQNESAYHEAILNQENRVHIRVALEKLCEFVEGCEMFWAQGIGFDYIILESALRKFGLDIPWKFWNLRDLRTVLGVVGVSLKRVKRKYKMVEHNALNDCYVQLMALREALRA
jgi:hypothetical protein